MSKQVLLSLILSIQVCRQDVGFLLNKSRCAYVIANDVTSVGEISSKLGDDDFFKIAMATPMERIIFSYTKFQYLPAGARGTCQPTVYIIESYDAELSGQLFRNTQKDKSIIFVPYTNIILFLNVIHYNITSDTRRKELKQTLLAFTRLHAHAVYFIVDCQLSRFYQGEQGNEDLREQIDWNSWKPNFQNTNDTFKAGLHHYPPYVSMDPQTGSFEGLDKFILTEITKSWRVEYVYFSDPSVAYDQAARHVRENKLNTALCAVWHVRLPTDLYDATFPYTETCITFIVPKASRTKSRFFLIDSHPYTFWLAAILNLLFTSVAIHFIETLCGNARTTLMQVLFSEYGVLLMNSMTNINIPRQSSARIIYTSWLILVVVLATMYSSEIATSLTVPKCTRPIAKFRDIVENNLTWQHDGNGSYAMFKDSVDPDLRRIVQNAVGENSRIPKNKLVTIANVFFRKYVSTFVSSGNGKELLKECAGVFYYVYPLNKHSSYKLIFDRKINMMVEGGLIEKWTEMLYLKHKNDPAYMLGVLENKEYVIDSDLINLWKIQGLLVIVTCCYLVCIATFLTEILGIVAAI